MPRQHDAASQQECSTCCNCMRSVQAGLAIVGSRQGLDKMPWYTAVSASKAYEREYLTENGAPEGE